MSELIQKNDNRATIRWKLLTGASAIALAGYLSSAGMARAEDSGHPVIWLEAGGEFALQSVNTEQFIPSFVYDSTFGDGIKVLRKKAPSVWDEDAKISFQPSGSDWVMSLGIRYGKSSRHMAAYQNTQHIGGTFGYAGAHYSGYQDSKSSSSEKHLILDFEAGKDVGLGRFGSQGSSLVSAGVRYAQFDSHSNVDIKSRTTSVPTSYYIFHGSFEAKRNFRGVGPSLSWDASATVAGNPSDGSLTFDWGVNGALLFGRQKMKGHHEKTAVFQPQSAFYYGYLKTTRYHTPSSPSRSKNVTVPNLGAYAAMSWRYTNAKVTLGYRYDAFFGAIDGGIDAAKKEDRGFYGPFASISIGIGD